MLGAPLGSNMKDGSISKIFENRFARADLEHILLCVDDDMRMEALRQTNYVKSIVTAQGKMDLERKGKQSYQGWMFTRLLAFSNGDLQALYDRSDGFYRRQLVLTTKEKPAGRVDDPDLAEKMKAEVEGIFLWAFEGLQRLATNNFKFTESQRTRDNREAVKRDNNNVFDFLDSEGYIRLKANCTISSKELYEIYRMWCEENNLMPLKRRSFSDSVITSQSKYNLEYCNKITNAAGRHVWGFFGIEAVAKPNINGFSDTSERTYRRNGDEFSRRRAVYVCTQRFSPNAAIWKTAGFTAVCWNEKSSQLKFANYLTDGRKHFTESRFSEQQHGYAEAWETIRYRAKSHGAEKPIGVTCEQDFITTILSGFDSIGIVHDTAKRMRRMAYRLRFFII